MTEPKRNKFRLKKSPLWTFFNVISESVASCELCNHRISYRSTTNNLRKHLARKHPDAEAEVILKTAKRKRKSEHSCTLNDEQNNIDESMVASDNSTDAVSSSLMEDIKTSPVPSLCSTSFATSSMRDTKEATIRSKYKVHFSKFNIKLLNLFIKDFQPYRIIEDNAFKEFVSFLSASYQFPTKRHLSKTIIPELYKKCLSMSKELIEEGEIYCISLETWTSANSDSFLTVTAHFVSCDFTLNSILLDCSMITYERNRENIAYEIKRVVSEWGIEEKIQFVVSENDTDLQGAVSDILGYEHFICFADTINMIVKESIQSLEIFRTIEKVSTLVTFLKKNSEFYERLIADQEETGETDTGLSQISDARCFRSIYIMLNKFLKSEAKIRYLLEEIDVDIALLNEEEWKIAHQMAQILKPFESVIKTISAEKYCPASIVIPVVNGLRSVCSNLLKKTFLPVVRDALVDLKESLINNFNSIETSATLSVCTFLDPRFKNLAFTNKSLAIRTQEVVLSALTSAAEMENSIKSPESVDEEPTISGDHSNEQPVDVEIEDDVSVWSTFDNKVARLRDKPPASIQAMTEVNRYLDEEILPRQGNPLLWWKENRFIYPSLSNLAKSQLCAVSTSVPCDRYFTKAGLILNERRSKISENNTKMLVFLNANFQE